LGGWAVARDAGLVGLLRLHDKFLLAPTGYGYGYGHVRLTITEYGIRIDAPA